jgi:hypothetical protein
LISQAQFRYLAFLTLTLIAVYPTAATGQNASPTSSNGETFAKSDTLYVKQMLLAKDVVERMPIDVVQAFEVSDQEGWCFARLYNSGELTTVRFKWFYEEQKYFTFDAKVGQSTNWRTYSSITLQPGSWRVVLEDSNGDQLDEIRFHVSQ